MTACSLQQPRVPRAKSLSLSSLGFVGVPACSEGPVREARPFRSSQHAAASRAQQGKWGLLGSASRTPVTFGGPRHCPACPAKPLPRGREEGLVSDEKHFGTLTRTWAELPPFPACRLPERSVTLPVSPGEGNPWLAAF